MCKAPHCSNAIQVVCITSAIYNHNLPPDTSTPMLLDTMRAWIDREQLKELTHVKLPQHSDCTTQ